MNIRFKSLKNMKKLVFVFILWASFCWGQKVRVMYEMQYKTDTLQEKIFKKIMLLDIKQDNSRFYSQKLYSGDSAVFASIKMNQPVTKRPMDYDFMVLKYRKENIIKRYSKLYVDVYEVEEKAPVFSWEIKNETKEIGNFTCQRAILNYGGRKWEAWFAKDIIIQDGPYIFSGLPGLIVSLYDEKRNYSFQLVQIKNDFYDFYRDDEIFITPYRVNRRQLEKVYIDHYLDPYREAKAGKIIMNFMDENGKEITPNFNELTIYKQQELKRNNNPILITEAINYPRK